MRWKVKSIIVLFSNRFAALEDLYALVEINSALEMRISKCQPKMV
jgi:hypothetical protein